MSQIYNKKVKRERETKKEREREREKETERQRERGGRWRERERVNERERKSSFMIIFDCQVENQTIQRIIIIIINPLIAWVLWGYLR